MAEKKAGKSRSGCHTCKIKRRKCDEHKPHCLQCENRGIKCGGYTTKFKWRPCHDSDKSASGATFARARAGNYPESIGARPAPPVGVKSEPAPQSPQLSLQEHLELASLSVAGKSATDLKFDNELLAQGIDPATFDGRGAMRAPARRRSVGSAAARAPARAMHRSYSHGDQSAKMAQFRVDMRRPSTLDSLAEAAVDEIRRSPAASPGLDLAFFRRDRAGMSPGAMSPRLALAKEAPALLSPPARDPVSDLNLTPSLSALLNHVFTDDKPDAALSPLDLCVTPGPGDGAAADESADTRADAEPSSLLADVTAQLQNTPLALPSGAGASLAHTSEQQQILFLYSSYTCGIMSIKAGATENPWRNAVVAQAHRYSFLFNSIASMTLFHLAGNTRLGANAAALRSKGYLYMKKCILELASRLSKVDSPHEAHNGLPADIALATCLNLAVSESWDTHTSSGIAHLKGAKSMIQKVLELVRRPRAPHAVAPWLAAAKKKLVLVTDDEWDRLAAATDDDKLYVPRNLQLLFNTWVYFEVLSQMTSHSMTDDKGIDLVATITKVIHTMHPDTEGGSPTHSDHSHHSGTAAGANPSSGLGSISSGPDSISSGPSSFSSAPDSFPSGSFSSGPSSIPSGPWGNVSGNFFDKLDSMLHDNDYVDPLLGCAQSLFLVMGRVAALIARVRHAHKKASRNALAHITQAAELRKQLVDWKPMVSLSSAEIHDGADLSTWDLYSCMATAEAYRHATLLYLYQAVPEVASVTTHQLAEKIFVLLASIPLTSNLHITHIFPLLVASCEATPGEEREWCEARWAMLSERIWIGNIDRALEVVKEVWRRTDEMSRKVSREADDMVLGGSDLGSVHGLLANIGAAPTGMVVGISSRCHWGAVMREWNWEVLLA